MKDFDWVEARNNCTSRSAFDTMVVAVRADIERRIDQDESLAHTLDVDKTQPDELVVHKRGSHKIVFKRIGETIEVASVHASGQSHKLVVVTVGMNEEGECTLRDGSKELKSWQVRRLALEETFFGG